MMGAETEMETETSTAVAIAVGMGTSEGVGGGLLVALCVLWRCGVWCGRATPGGWLVSNSN